MKRLFIESDILHEDDLQTAERRVAELLEGAGEKVPKKIFHTTIDYAWHALAKVWELVLSHDEIYANSSLMPLVGNSYTGAPVIFNAIMAKAIEENLSGKKVFLLTKLKDLEWDMIKVELLPKAFKNNSLYTCEWDEQRS